MFTNGLRKKQKTDETKDVFRESVEQSEKIFTNEN